MIHSSANVKDNLFNCITSIAETYWLYTDQISHFSRYRKISLSDVILSTICMQRGASKDETLNFFDFQTDAPTRSALIQQRNKLNYTAFEQLFYSFTDSLSPDLTLKGYRLFAVDGSDIHIPTNRKDPETFRITDKYGRGFNMLHLNATYDLLSCLFTDIIIQPCNHVNECLAMCDMVDRFAQEHPDENALFIADRGYVSFNVLAHVIENGAFFLIRGRDSSTSILSTIDLPDEPEFDITYEKILTRRSSNISKSNPDSYRNVASRPFDYLELKSNECYPICFRIIKFLLPNGTAEYVFTNLPREDFTISEIRDLYNRRWGIETSFRDIKYAANMLFFHSRKKNLVLQEIYSKLILYNFSEAIARGVVIEKKETKYKYRVNISLAISSCVEYLRRCGQGAPLIQLEALLRRDLIPVRPGRSSPRYIRARAANTFQYR